MRCASRVIGPLAAAAIAACGPGLGNCPGTTVLAAWHDDPARPRPGETWAGCASTFEQCGGSDAALARSSFCKAMALRAAGELDEAARALEKAASLDPGWAAPHAVLGTIALAQGDAQQAVAHLENALSLEPEWPGALNDLGLALQQLGDLEAALARLDARLPHQTLNAGTHPHRAGIHVQLGRASEAMVEYLTAIDLEPGEPLHYYNLAGLLENAGEWEKAAAAYAALLDLLPGVRLAAVHLKTAMMLEKAGELEEAREQYLAALELAPTSQTALESLAILSLRTGEHEEAWELLRRLGELAPEETAKTLFSIGSSLIAAGELGLAARAYGIAAQLQPTWPEPLMNLGAVMTSMGASQEAAQVLEKALALAPGDAGVLNNLGIVYSRMLELDGAEEALRAAVEADPDLASAHSQLGEVLRLAKKLTGSLEAHDTAVSLAPDSARFRARRARTLLDLGRKKDAWAALDAAEKLDPDDPTAALVRGIALLEKKKTHEQAVEALLRAVDLDPAGAEAHAMLALALAKTKNVDEARGHLQTALDLDPFLEKLDWVAKLVKKLG